MKITTLLEPCFKGKISLEEAIKKRRTEREFKKESLSLKELSQILWAGQGITGEKWGLKLRSAPSAGALYPLEIYLLVGEVKDLKPGIYHYLPESHSLEKLLEGDKRPELMEAGLGQESILRAPIDLVVAADYKITTVKYGERGRRYVLIEAGHVAQNICLQATSLNLATALLGAFDDKAVAKVLNLPEEQSPLYIIPIGHPIK